MEIRDALACSVYQFPLLSETMVPIKPNIVIKNLYIDPRDENGKGKPLVKPRNFQSGPCRKGQTQSSYFGKINSLAEFED